MGFFGILLGFSKVFSNLMKFFRIFLGFSVIDAIFWDSLWILLRFFKDFIQI